MSDQQESPEAVDVQVEWQIQRFPFTPDDPDDETFDRLPAEQKVGALFGVPTLAQELFDSGLLFLVNQAVLHHHGYALGVETYEVKDEDGREVLQVAGLTLHKSSDPEGVWFDEAGVRTGRRKLLAAGLIAGAPTA